MLPAKFEMNYQSWNVIHFPYAKCAMPSNFIECLRIIGQSVK